MSIRPGRRVAPPPAMVAVPGGALTAPAAATRLTRSPSSSTSRWGTGVPASTSRTDTSRMRSAGGGCSGRRTSSGGREQAAKRTRTTPATRRRRSVPVEPGHAVAVPGGVTAGELRRARALQEETDVVLVGHADAAVHLHALVADQQERIRAARLGEARRARNGGVVAPPVAHARRGPDRRARDPAPAEHPP